MEVVRSFENVLCYLFEFEESTLETPNPPLFRVFGVPTINACPKVSD